MSYLALARRERPQRFADVVGQEHIVRTLQNAIRTERVHHAYLFCGTRGVGKTSTARILAKALNCEKGPAEEPCNVCPTCVDITEGSAVDVIEIDAATHRGVEEAQRFLDGVQYRPVRDRVKFYIVDEVHMMTRHAFNALLKTFEEPPPHVKFVLATTEAHQVPGTILSRCQRFDFRELSQADIQGRLAQIVEREGIEVSARALGWVVREARGSMRDAQSLLDQVLAFADGSTISDEEVRQVLGSVDSQHVEAAIGALAAREPARALESVTDVAARGHDLKAFLAAILEALREAMVAKAAPAGGTGPDGRDEESAAILAQLGDTSLEDVVRWIEGLLRCQSDLQRSEDPRLTLETALVRAATLAPVRPFAELVAEVRALAAGGGGGGGGGGSGGGAETAPRARAGATRTAGAPPAGRVSRASEREDGPPPAPARAAPEELAKASPVVAPVAEPPSPAPPTRAPEAPPAADPVSALRDRVTAEQALIGRYLSRSDVRIEDNRVNVHAKPGAALNELSEEHARELIARVASEVLGAPAQLVIEARSSDPGGAETGANGNGSAPLTADRRLRSEAIDDPFVQEALGLFGGEIVEIRRHVEPDEEGKRP